MARRCDVLVVGAGPAGSTCAAHLVAAGFDVVIADRAVFPRAKPCAGWITPEVTASLRLDLDDYARGRTLQPVDGFEVGVLEGRRVACVFDHVVSYAIRRCELDAYLLRRCGAEVLEGVAVTHAGRRGDAWRAAGVEATMLVGAGGHFCPVARLLNPDEQASPSLIVAQEAEIELPRSFACPVSGTRPELYFCRDLRGYGWCVRKGDRLSVGMGRQDPVDLAPAVRAFVAGLQRAGRLPAPLLADWHGHAYLPYGRQARRRVGERILLIGDAAGLAFPSSGEGILPAVESGRLAAEVIARAAPCFDGARLAAYEYALSRRLGAPPAAETGTHQARPLRAWLARWAMGVPCAARRVLVSRFLHHA